MKFPTIQPRKLLVTFLWIAGLGFTVQCGLVLLRGGPVDLGWISVGNVRPRLVLAVLFLGSAYLAGEKGPPRRIRVANLCLLAFSLLISLGAVELGVRAFLQRTQGFNAFQQMHNPNPAGNLHTRSHHPLLVITRFSADKRLIYELKPGVDMRFGHKVLRTNSRGFRSDREFTPAKAPGTRRVLGVGDSGMWGWDLDQNQGYMEVMERLLNARAGAAPVEMINLAVPGYNTYQEYVALERKGLEFQPDVVVIGWCDNDYQLPFFLYTRRDHWKQRRSYVFNLLFDRHRFSEMVTPEVLKLGDIPPDTVDPEVLAHSGEEGVRKTLGLFRRLADTHGFQVVLFGPLNKTILDLCAEADIPTINTYELADRNPPQECAVFFMHPRACGHEILGEFLAERLQVLGWL